MVGRKAQALSHIFAEEGQVVKAHLAGYFLDAQVAIKQQLLDAADNGCSNKFARCGIAVLAADAGQVFGRYAQLIGIGLDTSVDISVVGQQEHETAEDAVPLTQHVFLAALVQVLVDVGKQIIGEATDDVAHGLAAEIQLGVAHLESEQVVILDHQVHIVLSHLDDRIGQDVHDRLHQALVDERETDVGADAADQAAEVIAVLNIVDDHLAVNNERTILLQVERGGVEF